MSATIASRTTATSEALTHRQILTILSGLVLGMFLAALDQTIVSTSIKTIGSDLNDLSAQAWVTTAFLITSTIAAPLYGKLSDIFGRKRLFMFGITLFVVGSALCGLSQSMYELAAFRAFQGLGAGGVMPLALAIIGDIIPPRQRARYQGYMLATFASASVLGPLLGGLLAGTSSIFGIVGWRWIFYINVPIAAIALVVIAKVLPVDQARRARRIDWLGSIMLAIGLVPLLLVAEQGHEWGWTSVNSFLCCGVSVAGVATFLFVEGRMGEDAILPLSLFRSPTFAVASAQTTVVGIAMFGGLAVVPLYLQIVKGASPTKSGLLMLPLILGLMATSLVVGRLIARRGRYKIFPVIGSFFLVIGVGMLTQIAADTPLWRTDIGMLIFGIGLGLSMQSLVLAMQNSVSANHMGVASASSTFFRSIGGTLGTAFFLSILFSRSATNISNEYAKARSNPTFIGAGDAHPGQLATLNRQLGRGLNQTSYLSNLAKPLSHPFYVGFSNAAGTVFLCCLVLVVTTIALAFALKEVPLRHLSGNQARERENSVAALLG